jgi:hypothetical protein
VAKGRQNVCVVRFKDREGVCEAPVVGSFVSYIVEEGCVRTMCS